MIRQVTAPVVLAALAYKEAVPKARQRTEFS